MGVITFRLPSFDPGRATPDLRHAYGMGLDRMPSRLRIEPRNGYLTCYKDNPESIRFFVPWPVPGHGMPIVGTATLVERPAPYNLEVELARGKLNDVRNQVAEWTQLGLRTPPSLDQALARSGRAFVQASGAIDEPAARAAKAAESLAEAWHASAILLEAYTAQILDNRLAVSPRLPTAVGIVLDGQTKAMPPALVRRKLFNQSLLSFNWRAAAPSEGQYRWDVLDAQLAQAKTLGLPVEIGPLIDLRKGALPDWIWLWEGDPDAIAGLAADFVRHAVTRYRGKIPLWHIIHRVGCGEILGLSEEDQIRVTLRALQVARQADPSIQLTIGVDRPWAEWMGSSRFQLGPLHVCDYLKRCEVGLSAVLVELAPGFTTPGSHVRDTLELSRLLDLYSLLDLPLHVWMAIPTSDAPDPLADPSVKVDPAQWPGPLDEARQSQLAAHWLALVIAKPYVRSVGWMQPDDSTPHLYPHAGLLRGDGQPKPIVPWLERFRTDYLA